MHLAGCWSSSHGRCQRGRITADRRLLRDRADDRSRQLRRGQARPTQDHQNRGETAHIWFIAAYSPTFLFNL